MPGSKQQAPDKLQGGEARIERFLSHLAVRSSQGRAHNAAGVGQAGMEGARPWPAAQRRPAEGQNRLRLHRETTMTLSRIAERLQMGTNTHLAHLLHWQGRKKGWT